MPIYKVTFSIPAKGADAGADRTRLIEAANTAAAMRHAADGWIMIEKCTTSEAVELGAAGVTVEKAD
jgi:hypothetical protein